jgi:hypothetical protein
MELICESWTIFWMFMDLISPTRSTLPRLFSATQRVVVSSEIVMQLKITREFLNTFLLFELFFCTDSIYLINEWIKILISSVKNLQVFCKSSSNRIPHAKLIRILIIGQYRNSMGEIILHCQILIIDFVVY